MSVSTGTLYSKIDLATAMDPLKPDEILFQCAVVKVLLQHFSSSKLIMQARASEVKSEIKEIQSAPKLQPKRNQTWHEMGTSYLLIEAYFMT